MQKSSLDAVFNLWSRAGALHRIPITGTSMLPLIRKGDHVLVAHGSDEVRRGDVVVIRHGDKLIAHRVLRICTDVKSHRTFITKGDNAPQCDPPWSSSEIVGRVLSISRGEEELSLDTPFWRALGGLITCSTLVWIKLSGLRRKTRQKLLGSHCGYVAALQRRGLHACVFSVRKILLVTLCRWKS